uniref:Uncharacterized protein n=1 Tax=Anopheles atroparvus TaxID=41427 RepID=A0A182IV56_ANOAO
MNFEVNIHNLPWGCKYLFRITLLHPAHDRNVGQPGRVLARIAPHELLYQRLPVASPPVLANEHFEQATAARHGHVELHAYALPGVANILAPFEQPVTRNRQTLDSGPSDHHPMLHGFAESERSPTAERTDVDEAMLDHGALVLRNFRSARIGGDVAPKAR